MTGLPNFDVWRSDSIAKMVAGRYRQRMEALETELLVACRNTTDPKVAKALGNYRAAYEVYALLMEKQENRDG